ncbi:ATP-dependent RNA helicase RhlB [Desulfacinum hydrothermale DSM 13146]|uniref:ATP-dependent RNA helicase RhlB n=1 Tax=Desulfacinum hydrothermale DSM 13146 TaxID=1121390 RepID=A0A1W1WYC1_9BACT|nr:DEAD/DEAH box helicase [Desulfacinum hydrothermale]SMC16593.1 ATP-dependent RNA helicase RhlB [Desulfacinum hydrothermale DSM 13146]
MLKRIIHFFRNLFQAPSRDASETPPGAVVEPPKAAVEPPKAAPEDPPPLLQARKARSDVGQGLPFAELNLAPEVLRGLHEAGYVRCTPIQEKSLPIALEGKDLAAQAQTGSGKTAVFLVTIFQKLGRQENLADTSHALILAPTRELALQIQADAELLGRYLPLRTVAIYGGVGYNAQVEALKQGAHIVIATPGRLIDLMKQGIFRPHDVSMLVIDEADRMLDMGFVKDLRYIMRKLPPYSRRQTLLFSATLSLRVLELTYQYMNVPEEVVVNPEQLVVETVHQELYHVGRPEKFSLLLGLLGREKPERALIFCNTKAQTSWVADRLGGNGYQARAITGDLPQARRIKLLERFKAGQIQILVATDVASRGLHVEDVTHVFNYDVPQDPEEFVHRIGRTARAGKEGRAITLCCEDDVYALENVEKLLGNKIPVVWADDDLFVADKAKKRRTRRPPRKKRSGSGPKDTKAKQETTPEAKRRRRRPRKKRKPKGKNATHSS